MAYVRSVLLAMGVAVMAFACDDNRKGSGAIDADTRGMGGAGGTAPILPPVMSGIPGDTPLSGLTPAQQETLCEETAEFTEKALASPAVQLGVCRLTAVLAASSGAPTTQVEVCTETLAACIAGIGQTTGVDAGVAEACAGGGGAVPTDCDVTVAQYEACLNSVPGGLAALDRVLPACNALSADAGAFNPALLALLLSPACITIATTCGGSIPVVPPVVMP